jgi:cytochrome c oxidase subunit I
MEAEVPHAGVRVAAPDAAVRWQMWGWSAVAVGALAIAGVFALLLAVSRIPGVEAVAFWPLDFFYKGLVIHVVFSFVVWFLAVFALMSVLARERLSHARRSLDSLGLAALSGAVLSLPLLFVPAFLDRGEPTLNNYVPVIIDPLYYGGLAILAVAAGLVAARLLAAARPRSLRQNPLDAMVAAAALAYLLACLCFALAHARLGGSPWSYDFNEALMWGGGHILQFVNTLLLLVAWIMLAAPWTTGGVPTRALAVAGTILLAGAVAGPLFYAVFPPFSAEQMRAFTWLQYLLGPSAAIVAIALLSRLGRPLPWREPPFLAFALSLLLFAVGGVLGLFVDGADTRTPAHYHGVIASVTLAFFGLFFARFLPLLDRHAATPRRQRLIVHLFAWGQLAACIGLFIAGGHGAPRKVAGEAQGLVDLAPMIGMGMNGLGGLVAVIGGGLFVWTVAVALIGAADAKKPATASALPI